MDLNLLVAFEALFRERSVTRAGRRLGLSQPATSAALARLRQSFGDPLFTSTPRGLEPTAHCLALAGPVGAALEQLRAALSQEQTFDPATTTADLRLGAVDAVMAAVLHGVAARVLSEAPRARLRLTSIDPRTAPNLLDEGSIDLAVAPAFDPPAHLQVRPLFPLSFVVACRPGHPLPRRPKLRDLARHPHVIFSFAGPPRTAVDDAFERAGLQRHVAVVVSSFLSVPLVLAVSDAVAILPEPFARTLAAAGQVRCAPLPPEVTMPEMMMKMLWSSRTGDLPAARWLRELVVAAVRERFRAEAQ